MSLYEYRLFTIQNVLPRDENILKTIHITKKLGDFHLLKKSS